jgi:integrase/recombinase XerD
MIGLRVQVEDYLRVRRALGFQLVAAGQLLTQFADFAATVGADTITMELALQWATLPQGRSVTWYAQRLGAVRCFARWLQAIDPATEVPPTDLLPGYRPRRITPYLYSDTDITGLITAAGQMDSPLAAATMQTFIGLVFTTGMRRGEVLGLDRGDLDPDTGVLSVRQAKFGKPRQLPRSNGTTDTVSATPSAAIKPDNPVSRVVTLTRLPGDLKQRAATSGTGSLSTATNVSRGGSQRRSLGVD